MSKSSMPIAESAAPAHVLLVDDDAVELSSMAERLQTAGFQVTTAMSGSVALELLDEQWFPIVLADWDMPEMDGVQLAERIRERGGDDTFFIMLSEHATREDFERGYAAGVDDYLAKQCADAELMARVRSGLHTVELRRSLRQTRAALLSSKLAAESGDARGQLLSRMQTEIARARRYRRPCSLLTLGLQVEPPPENAREWRATPELRAALMQAVRGVIRVDIDWAGTHETDLEGHPDRSFGFAIVLPETGPAEAIAVRTRIRAALLQRMRELIGGNARLKLNVGAVSIDPGIDNPQLTAETMLASAGRCRRCMADRGASRLHAVQASVANKVSIPCRQGYAVADHCLELKRDVADPA